ncbi:MAG: UDP-glucose 4-epimerase GalE [Bacteroidota bacterium]
MKIVVTGGTGYIGSHTVVELLQQGHSVHILDNLSNSDISMIDRIQDITGKRPDFTKLDLTEAVSVDAFFYNQTDIDGIIHFAALKSVGESVKLPLSYYQNNILCLVHVLKAAARHSIYNFVFSSSCTVYGTPDRLPVTEDTPIGYTPSPYGATKQMCERIIEDFTHAQTGFKAISLRYFNPLGAHSSRLIGELPTGIPNNLLPYITQTAAGIREYLSVFGSDYNTHDGTAIRDYIHVTDVALAHSAALDYMVGKNNSVHEKLNVGTGKGLSVLEVIHSFEKTSGLKLNYKVVERREGDVEAIYADANKAEELLDWKARFTIDDMTQSAWEWEKKLRSI